MADVIGSRACEGASPNLNKPLSFQTQGESVMEQSLRVTSRRSVFAALVCAVLLAAVLIGVGQRPAAAATPPVANNDAYTTQSLTPLTVATPGVLANDT